MVALYPLRFRPILRRYLWGGRRLETVLGKRLASGNDWGESWEICDHGSDQSVVEFGPLAGTTLGQLVVPTTWLLVMVCLVSCRRPKPLKLR